jgi:predicted alpha/beta hydrolase family esterase
MVEDKPAPVPQDARGRAPPAAGRRLLLPGWQNSGPTHWQSRWEARHGDERVGQDDWIWPRRGDWMARLEEIVLADTAPVLLIAHSLGCQLVAAWSAHSPLVGRIQGALLVAPPDTERADSPPQLFNWRPIVRAALPFPSLLVYSSNDPFCSVDRALGMARDWRSQTIDLGPCGHVNGESGLGDWPQGRALLAILEG